MLSEENKKVFKYATGLSSKRPFLSLNHYLLNDLLNAVRREERERAIAVLRPLVECISMNVRPSPTEVNRASSYITQAEGGETT